MLNYLMVILRGRTVQNNIL